MVSISDIKSTIREKGLKVTPQRMAIYSAMLATKEHPSAESIYKSLGEEQSSMSLATVYKTLDSFKKAGLVMELNVGDGCSHYDATTDCHPHVVCNKCHRVNDLDISGFDNIRRQVCDKTDYQLESEQLIFYGTCPDCLAEMNDSKAG